MPSSLGLQVWPAANPQNPQSIDLVIAPLALCQQMTATDCSEAVSHVSADGIARYVVGTAASMHVEAGDLLSCSAL